MSARKIGMLLLLLACGGAIESAWSLRGDLRIGPEGCRVIGGRFYGPSFSFEQSEERALSPSARIEVKNAFGEVRVTAGAAGVAKVRLRKVVYQPTEAKARAFADRVELRLSGEGPALSVGTNRETIGRGEDVGFETHLELELPPDSVLSVRNEHGPVDLSGVAAADVESSFEGVSVERIARDLKIESSHGDVNVEDVQGGLELSSRHGNVSVRQLSGAGKLDVQHGELTAERTGALTINAQHGPVHASSVAGDLVVRAGHSAVDASDVLGSADVETSFGSVRFARIGGSARARVEHGSLAAEDVSGGVSADSSHDGVQLERVGGRVELTVQHGGVVGNGLAHGARVRASGGDVTLEGFSGEVELDLERGNARVSPRAVLSAPLTISVRNGEAQLELPEGSAVDLVAESRRGELHAEAPQLAVSRDEQGGHGPGGRLHARMGSGGQPVKVNADGDVRVTTRSAEAIADRDVAKPELGQQASVAGEAARPSRLPAEKPPAGARDSSPAPER